MNDRSALHRIGQVLESALLSERAYVVSSVLLVAYTFLAVLDLSCAGTYADFWEHIAFMRAFAQNPLHPPNPYIAGAVPYHHHSPYHLFWGLVSRALGVNPFLIAPFIGAINVGFFVVAVRIFAKRIVGDRRYALPLLLALLFLWWLPWGWSGFYNFGLLHLTAIYPYRFAFPLALVMISLYPGKGPVGFVAFTLLTSLTFLVHALTGSFLVLSFLILALTTARNARSPARLVWLLPPIGGMALALFWPYFPVAETIMLSHTALTADYHLFYEGAIAKLLLALPGLYGIWQALRSGQVTYVTAGFLVTSGLYLANYAFLHLASLSRYIVYVAFYLHLGVVMVLRTHWEHRLRGLFVAAFAVLLVWGGVWEAWLATQYLGVARDLRAGVELGYHSDRRLFRELRCAFGPRLTEHDVVWARAFDSLMLPVFFECRVVTMKHLEPNPYIPAAFAADRIEAERRFFSDDAASEERVAILRRFGVTRLYVSDADRRFLSDVEDVVRPVAHAEGEFLYELMPG